MQADQSTFDRRRIWAWCLYDFGNSSFAVLFGAMFAVYYTEDIVAPYYTDVLGVGESDIERGGVDEGVVAIVLGLE